jgi:hypothetical protein
MMRTVRSTIEPDKDLLVDDATYNDLKGQGLLLPGYDGAPYTGEIPAAKVPGQRDNKEEK